MAGKRSVFGFICKWALILWNLLMLWWAGYAIFHTANGFNDLGQAGQTGAAVGMMAALVVIMFVWVMGSVILAIPTFLTRPG